MTANQADDSILNKLAELDVAEQTISAHRTDLFKLIATLNLSAPLTDAETALLQRLEEQERDISAQRRRLHAQISELCARLDLAAGNRAA